MHNNNIIVILDDVFSSKGWVIPSDSLTYDVVLNHIDKKIFLMASKQVWNYDTVDLDVVKKVRKELLEKGVKPKDCMWAALGGTLPSNASQSRKTEKIKVFYLGEESEVDRNFFFLKKELHLYASAFMTSRAEYEGIFWKLFDDRFKIHTNGPIHE